MENLLALDGVEALIQQHGGQSLVTGEVNAGHQITDFRDPLIEDFSLAGREIRFSSARPFDAIAMLSNRHNLRFDTLQMSRPDLESVFLNLTGRSLRD